MDQNSLENLSDSELLELVKKVAPKEEIDKILNPSTEATSKENSNKNLSASTANKDYFEFPLQALSNKLGLKSLFTPSNIGMVAGTALLGPEAGIAARLGMAGLGAAGGKGIEKIANPEKTSEKAIKDIGISGISGVGGELTGMGVGKAIPKLAEFIPNFISFSTNKPLNIVKEYVNRAVNPLIKGFQDTDALNKLEEGFKEGFENLVGSNKNPGFFTTLIKNTEEKISDNLSGRRIIDLQSLYKKAEELFTDPRNKIIGGFDKVKEALTPGFKEDVFVKQLSPKQIEIITKPEKFLKLPIAVQNSLASDLKEIYGLPDNFSNVAVLNKAYDDIKIAQKIPFDSLVTTKRILEDMVDHGIQDSSGQRIVLNKGSRSENAIKSLLTNIREEIRNVAEDTLGNSSYEKINKFYSAFRKFSDELVTKYGSGERGRLPTSKVTTLIQKGGPELNEFRNIFNNFEKFLQTPEYSNLVTASQSRGLAQTRILPQLESSVIGQNLNPLFRQGVQTGLFGAPIAAYLFGGNRAAKPTIGATAGFGLATSPLIMSRLGRAITQLPNVTPLASRLLAQNYLENELNK